MDIGTPLEVLIYQIVQIKPQPRSLQYGYRYVHGTHTHTNYMDNIPLHVDILVHAIICQLQHEHTESRISQGKTISKAFPDTKHDKKRCEIYR